jgi:hypothetical protein
MSVPWLLAGALIACAWCSFLSGIGGWIMGRDINGAHVEDARDLRDQLRTYRSGDTVRLTVLGETGQSDVAVKLEAFPGDSRRPYLGVYYTARGEDPADL